MTVGLDRLEPKRSPLAERQTPQTIGQSPSRADIKVQLGEPLLYRFKNLGTQPLYFVGFAQSPKQELILLTHQSGLVVPPDSVKKVTFEFEPLRPIGTWQTYWIGGDRPFENFQLLLDKLFAGLEASSTTLEKPLPLVLALLKDLHTSPTDANDNKENYRLSSKNWVTSRFVYEVVETL
jgi:hypothetical protein